MVRIYRTIGPAVPTRRSDWLSQVRFVCHQAIKNVSRKHYYGDDAEYEHDVEEDSHVSPHGFPESIRLSPRKFLRENVLFRSSNRVKAIAPHHPRHGSALLWSRICGGIVSRSNGRGFSDSQSFTVSPLPHSRGDQFGRLVGDSGGDAHLGRPPRLQPNAFRLGPLHARSRRTRRPDSSCRPQDGAPRQQHPPLKPVPYRARSHHEGHRRSTGSARRELRSCRSRH